MRPGAVDWHTPYDAALDTLLGSVNPRQVAAFVNLLAAHEALMPRVEAQQGYPTPRAP